MPDGPARERPGSGNTEVADCAACVSRLAITTGASIFPQAPESRSTSCSGEMMSSPGSFARNLINRGVSRDVPSEPKRRRGAYSHWPRAASACRFRRWRRWWGRRGGGGGLARAGAVAVGRRRAPDGRATLASLGGWCSAIRLRRGPIEVDEARAACGAKSRAPRPLSFTSGVHVERQLCPGLIADRHRDRGWRRGRRPLEVQGSSRSACSSHLVFVPRGRHLIDADRTRRVGAAGLDGQGQERGGHGAAGGNRVRASNFSSARRLYSRLSEARVARTDLSFLLAKLPPRIVFASTRVVGWFNVTVVCADGG